jgi:hypothetical protein
MDPKKLPKNLRNLMSIMSVLKGHGHAVDFVTLEEIDPTYPIFSHEGQYTPIEDENKPPVTHEFKGDKQPDSINFKYFIDGVQRTTQIYMIRVDSVGCHVPVYGAHIAAGISVRDSDKRLKPMHDLIADRLILALPLEGLEKEGFEAAGRIRDFIDRGIAIEDYIASEDPYKAFSLGEKDNKKVIISDTTYVSLNKTRRDEDRKKLENNDDKSFRGVFSPLVGKQLANNYLIKQRALGRINTLRQILESTILTKLRLEKDQENYVAVDGPLLFLGKWMRKKIKNKTDRDREEIVLKNAVGIVKSLRALYGKPDKIKEYFNLKFGEHSHIKHITDEVDITKSSEGTYSIPHLTFYLRLREPPGGLKLPTYIGLVRIDLCVSTFGVKTAEEVKKMYDNNDVEFFRKFESIKKGILHEIWPLISDKRRQYTQLFPISETEKLLHSRLYKLQEMSYLHELIRA